MRFILLWARAAGSALPEGGWTPTNHRGIFYNGSPGIIVQSVLTHFKISLDFGQGCGSRGEQKRAEAEERQTLAKVRREHDLRVSSLEMRVATLESRQKELTAELGNPATYEKGGAAMELNRQLMAIADELARVTAEWEATAENCGSRIAD